MICAVKGCKKQASMFWMAEIESEDKARINFTFCTIKHFKKGRKYTEKVLK